MHLGARACDERRVDNILKYILNKEDCYALGIGDYADLIVRQDLKRFTGTCTKSELLDLLDSMLNQQTKMVIEKFKPLAEAGKLLGLGEGNHEDSTRKHQSYDMTKEVCERLKVPYLGYSFFYRLCIKRKRSGTQRNVVIYGHHGWGGGRTAGGSLNKLEHLLRYYDADIVISAHDHQKLGKRYIKLGMTDKGKPEITHKPIVVARAGTFLKTCERGHTTYAEKFGFPPTDLGVVKITINFEGHDKKLNLHVSE